MELGARCYLRKLHTHGCWWTMSVQGGTDEQVVNRLGLC